MPPEISVSMSSSKGTVSDPQLRKEVVEEVLGMPNKDGSGVGEMARWKSVKIHREYEARGGEYHEPSDDTATPSDLKASSSSNSQQTSAPHPQNPVGQKSRNIATKTGGAKPRGMNNEEKKADKAARMAGKPGLTMQSNGSHESNSQEQKSSSVRQSSSQQEESSIKQERNEDKMDIDSSDNLSGPANQREKVRQAGSTERPEGLDSSGRKKQTSTLDTQDPSGQKSKNIAVRTGGAKPRGMNNEEKKAEKAARLAKTQQSNSSSSQQESSSPKKSASPQEENGENKMDIDHKATSESQSQSKSSSESHVYGSTNQAEKVRDAGSTERPEGLDSAGRKKQTSTLDTQNPSGQKSQNIAVKTGGAKPRGMNNEEKKADKAARMAGKQGLSIQISQQSSESSKDESSEKQESSQSEEKAESSQQQSSSSGNSQQTSAPDPQNPGGQKSRNIATKTGGAKPRGMNNEEKKAEKAARMAGKQGVGAQSQSQQSDQSSRDESSKQETSQSEIQAQTSTSSSNGASASGPTDTKIQAQNRRNAGSTARPSGRDSSGRLFQTSTLDNRNPSGQKSRNLAVQSGGEVVRGMNNEEKKNEKRARTGAAGPDMVGEVVDEFKDTQQVKPGQHSIEESQTSAPDPRNPKGQKSQNIAVKTGGRLARAMNNSEKKADTERRTGRLPSHDYGLLSSSEKEDTPLGDGAPDTDFEEGDVVVPVIDDATYATGYGTGGYEKYDSGYLEEGAEEGVVANKDNIRDTPATPINQVDAMGDNEPEIGSDGDDGDESVDSEGDVAVEGEPEEEEPFGDEDKMKISQTEEEERKMAERPERPVRQSSRIKESIATRGKRKMVEPRESESPLVETDEEELKIRVRRQAGEFKKRRMGTPVQVAAG